MDEYAEHNRLIESLLRLGTIAEVQARPPRVRVQSGQLTTDWRPWFTVRAGTTSEWNPPSVGEQCLLLCCSGDPATGFVLLGIPSDQFPPPSASLDEHVRCYPDGATITYNHATGALSAVGIKTALLQAADKVTVDCPLTELTGDVHIIGKLTVDGEALIKSLLTYMAGMSGQGGASGKTVIRGDVEHIGSYAHSGGAFTSDTILQDNHRHQDSQGGMTSGPK